MKMQIFQSFLIIVISVFASIVNAGTVVDDFNRASLGPNWTADPEFQIVSNTLKNTATTPSWNYLAVFNYVANPSEVSFKWDLSGDVEGANSGGIAIYLNAASTSANGYFILRRYGYISLHPIVSGVAHRDQTIEQTTATLTRPQPGDIIKVIASTDGTGHHFNFYINGIFDGQVTDAAKQYGNGTQLYAGVCLYGSRNNPIDDFTIKAATITVTSPNGAEAWLASSVHNITWTTADYTGNVKIQYSLNNGSTWAIIAASTANSGTYSWTLPGSTSDQCLIKVSDASDDMPMDVSNAVFRILPSVEEISLLVPNGGQNWVINTNQNITWSATSNIVNVGIYYSINSGSTWSEIVASTTNDGSYTWTVPSQPTDFAKIKIQDASDGTPSDVSDGVFSMSSLVSLRAQDASGQPGTSGNMVNVWLNNQINLSGVFFELSDLPHFLTATNVTALGRAAGFTVRYTTTPGSVRIMIVSLSGAVIPVGNEPIAQITYTIAGGAPLGTSSALNFSNATISDASGNPVVPAYLSGLFHYMIKGDVTGDGLITEADVDVMINLFMGNAVPTAFQLMAGDMNNNGVIDLFDVLKIFDMTLPI
jgi:hypothetical protein